MKDDENKAEKLKNVDGSQVVDSPNKLHEKALKALKMAKELEAITPTRKVISEDGRIVRFVKIK